MRLLCSVGTWASKFGSCIISYHGTTEQYGNDTQWTLEGWHLRSYGWLQESICVHARFPSILFLVKSSLAKAQEMELPLLYQAVSYLIHNSTVLDVLVQFLKITVEVTLKTFGCPKQNTFVHMSSKSRASNTLNKHWTPEPHPHPMLFLWVHLLRSLKKSLADDKAARTELYSTIDKFSGQHQHLEILNSGLLIPERIVS